MEGKKAVAELLQTSFRIPWLAADAEWMSAHQHQLRHVAEVITVNEKELQQLSFHKAPQQVLALVEIPLQQFDPASLDQTFSILLDDIQDPGNLGTIIRVADWYGIEHIVCSPACADVYNPKTIQATMGSFARVKVWYEELDSVLSRMKVPVYGALMEGASLYKTDIAQKGALLIGNEGKGISENLQAYITNRITIPASGGAESLNAAIATAIICDARARAISA